MLPRRAQNVQLGWQSAQAAAALYKCDCVAYLGMAIHELGLQERKHLAFTLKDTKTIVGKLERIAAFVIHVLMAFFYLVIFNVSHVSQPYATSPTGLLLHLCKAFSCFVTWLVYYVPLACHVLLF